jgi:hypothetical protein
MTKQEMDTQGKGYKAVFKLKNRIQEVLDNWLVDDRAGDELQEVINQWSKEIVPVGALSVLETKAVSQQEIHDWATLNGYVMVKCTSIADRLKVEKVAREIHSEMLE